MISNLINLNYQRMLLYYNNQLKITQMKLGIHIFIQNFTK